MCFGGKADVQVLTVTLPGCQLLDVKEELTGGWEYLGDRIGEKKWEKEFWNVLETGLYLLWSYY